MKLIMCRLHAIQKVERDRIILTLEGTLTITKLLKSMLTCNKKREFLLAL